MRYLITSALPYINGVKHLGNLVGSMLPADVYARFLRARGEEVLYVCATDEHGTPAELAAAAAGLDVATFCTQQHAKQASVGQRFGLSYDVFGRSSSPQNCVLTQHFAARLDAEGLIEERVTEQMFSIPEQRFLPDRYIVGTCPFCGYPNARGDQCEHCTNVLDPTDLINPRSAVTGTTDLEVRESRHLFLLQSKLAPALRAWLDTKSDWPVLSRSIALKWLDEGLEDRGITRDLKWGVPVPRPGFEDKVFYVWFDAPIEYIAATKEWADARDLPDDAWRSWWYAADDVRYVQFMAKDNVPFHTIGFPSTIIGSREPWKLVDYLKSFNWLNYYGGKFSTSQNVGVFMDDALDVMPADVWRYYLMANAPESDDVSFTWESFAVAVNKDLADTLGNFVNRTMTFTARHFDSAIPVGGEEGDAERDLVAALATEVATYSDFLERMEFRKATQALRAIWSAGNTYLDRKEPWVTVKVDRDATAVTLRTALGLIVLFARLSAPFMPTTAATLADAFGIPEEERSWPTGPDLVGTVTPDAPFQVPELLFHKVSDDEITGWRERFGGQVKSAA